MYHKNTFYIFISYNRKYNRKYVNKIKIIIENY